MTDCVVDASVGIKLFLAEPLSVEAHRLFSQLRDEPTAQFHVPDLFYIECTNILWKYTRRFGLSLADANLYIQALGELALIPTATSLLMTTALNIASAHEISAYDACYVALAQQLTLPLYTADERLVRKLADTVHDVRWLGTT